MMVELNDDVAEIGPIPRRVPLPPRPAGRAGRRGRDGSKLGRPEFEPTTGHRNLVKAMVACGATPQIIAKLLQIGHSSLRRTFKAELAHGKAEVIAHLGASVVQKAMAGDNDMLKFYLRAQAGWRDSNGGNGDFPQLPGTEHGAGIAPVLVIGFLENEQQQTIDGEATETRATETAAQHT